MVSIEDGPCPQRRTVVLTITTGDSSLTRRSFLSTGDANHDIKPAVSKVTFGAGLGSIYARIAGMNHPTTGMPSNVILFPRAVDPARQPGTTSFGKFGDTGPFGSACAPFDPSDGG